MNETQQAILDDVLTYPGSTCIEIAERIFYTSGTVHKNLRRLENKNLVENQRSRGKAWRWYPVQRPKR